MGRVMAQLSHRNDGRDSSQFLSQIQPLSPSNGSSMTMDKKGTVDPVPERYQLGQELYWENCAPCHLGIPPQVFPTQTWQNLLQETEHYGRQLTLLGNPQRTLVWNYLKYFSRPLSEGEEVPYRVTSSRYFKALHPRVNFTAPVKISTCVSCHPGGAQYNFRELTKEWQNSP